MLLEGRFMEGRICGFPTKVLQSTNQYICNVLGGNWDPTDNKFSSVQCIHTDKICNA